MRRITRHVHFAELDRDQFDQGWQRLCDAGYPVEVGADEAWEVFAGLRAAYASTAAQLLYWTIAAPGPWSGSRRGFPDLIDRPASPDRWSSS